MHCHSTGGRSMTKLWLPFFCVQHSYILLSSWTIIITIITTSGSGLVCSAFVPLARIRPSDASSAATAFSPKWVVLKTSSSSSTNNNNKEQKKNELELMFCGPDACRDTNRERIVGHNQVVLTGPATGQVAYEWKNNDKSASTTSTLLLLVRTKSPDLLALAADALRELRNSDAHISILLDPSTAARLRHYHGIDHTNIRLWEPPATPGYGTDVDNKNIDTDTIISDANITSDVDLICTVGGDGLLLHTAMLFPGPMPPILSVSGGSLGFLTPFRREEMVDAILIALGKEKQQKQRNASTENESNTKEEAEEMDSNNNQNATSVQNDSEMTVFPPNMDTYPYEPLDDGSKDDTNILDDNPSNSNNHQLTAAPPRTIFNSGPRICLSIRMRLECQIVNRHGALRARYNVLNEVVIDRGSSSYLANLECFCDDVHLTTVQADGIIFATPTGSTAYSMAAGGSVVHPSVPAILVTPICPHVLSFRSMVFPDHVVLKCLVPEDARANTASVALDGSIRHELHRGDYTLVTASNYPVPTINRNDHSADWLGSLKENFHFNTRRRQRPL